MSESKAARPDRPLNPEVYPDIVAADSLAAALATVAAELGLNLGTLQVDADNPVQTAGIVSLIADREPAWVGMNGPGSSRWFWIFGRSRGVALLTGDDDELAGIARAAQAWRQGATLREIQQVLPYIEVSELLEAHERGPAEAVAVKWRHLLVSLRDDADENPFARATLRVAEIAFAEPVLRGLYPVTGHWELDFLSSTGDPAVFEVPSVQPLEGGRYRVHRPGRKAVIGEVDTAAEAVALVMAQVPAGLGPAVAGGSGDAGPG